MFVVALSASAVPDPPKNEGKKVSFYYFYGGERAGNKRGTIGWWGGVCNVICPVDNILLTWIAFYYFLRIKNNAVAKAVRLQARYA